ncbi:c-type cytochrome [Alkalilacustris brevis]|uniref:c-type cytochrome n=1 Tax=Alkalilacustris brevis TaxID=2026338 RepID=UPI000E0DC3CD|nr:c-type cytochrome [Alkalilacustris brevis]
MAHGWIAQTAIAAAVSLTALTGQAAAQTAVPLGDEDHGAALWQAECAACHQIGAGAEHDIGPHLNRVFGRRAGSLEGFAYSDSIARMGRDGLRWDIRTLDAYIENPYSLVSGTRMAYPGLPGAEDRADLIAFLRVYSDAPSDIPGAPPTARRVEPDLPEEVLAIEGDREYGQFLASECTTCHQRGGAAQGIPSITNWPEERFVVAMHAYRQGLRPHDVMQSVARRLDDEQIAALASYFATIDD